MEDEQQVYYVLDENDYNAVVKDFKNGKFLVEYRGETMAWGDKEMAENSTNFAEMMGILVASGWKPSASDEAGEERDQMILLLNGYKPIDHPLWGISKIKHQNGLLNNEMGVKVLLALLQTEKYGKLYKAGMTRGLWVALASEMTKLGFNLGEKPSEKLCNKWRSLVASYRTHKRSQKETGKGKEIPPPFFDEIDQIEGESHATTPPLLIDSGSPNPVLKTKSGSLGGNVKIPKDDVDVCSTKSAPAIADGNNDAKSHKENFDQSSSGGDAGPSVPKPGTKRNRRSLKNELKNVLSEIEQNEKIKNDSTTEFQKKVVEILEENRKSKEEEKEYKRNRDKKKDEQFGQLLAVMQGMVGKKKKAAHHDDSD